jgi:hypothetical protein
MALICGLHSNVPALSVVFPQKKLSDLNTTYPTQTVKDAKAFLELYLRDHVTGEEVLKAHGLCPLWFVFLFHS